MVVPARPEARPGGWRGSRWSAGDRTGRLVAAAAILLLLSCAIGPGRTATPVPPTPTAQRAGPTPEIGATATSGAATATGRVPTPTPGPATVTLAPTRPRSTASSSPPAATPSPSPLAPQAVIHTFRASVAVADPGDTITLTWRWSGGGEATIYHVLPSGQLGTPVWEVGPTGSLAYTISPERRNSDTFALFVTDEAGLAVQETVQVALRCPDEWFFSPAPDICPAGPATITAGAEEHFRRGTMLWAAAEDRIYVLFEDEQYPRWRAYEDEWDEGEPTMDRDIEPPPGFQQPVRGFGLVWREEPGVAQRLGWAVDEERGYETAVQRSSHARYPVLYIRALNGGVWELAPNGSAWERIRAATRG